MPTGLERPVKQEDARFTYRGVTYFIKQRRNTAWYWEIHAPDAVIGMGFESGEVAGHEIEAIMAAQRAIDTQYGDIESE